MKLRHIGIVLLLLLTACHTIQVDVSDQPPGRVVKDRKAFFLAGVIPTRDIDMKSICPEGTVSITENTSFLDGFLGVITIGIYTPRTTVYTCAL